MKPAMPKFWLLVCSVVLALVALLLSDRQVSGQVVDFTKPGEGSPLKFKVTTGAAPGYVEDKTCATCHSEIYQSYQAVGMAKSFTTPSRDKFIENFDLPPFYHDKSQRYFQVLQQGDELTFKRWQQDENGLQINLFEQKIDYILGSGHKTRSYLYRAPGGELFQLPIGWYTQEQQWGLSPGYDNPHHMGVKREVARQCMFCHNGFAEVELGSDEHFQPHIFPEQLPHGTGCQRCHGPGAEHVQTVLNGAQSIEQIHATIVNPAKLPVDKRDSVCFQCHMLPSVDLVGVRNFARNDYSFRPGEDINDYLHHVEVLDEKVPTEQRFEINHHAYRLRASSCFTQSEGALTCISCHNPHKKVPEAERAEHYGKVCQSCHEQEHNPPLSENTDCVSCHMPQRRTQDVVRVVMTDHKIQKNNEGRDWLAPLHEEEPILSGLEFLQPEKSPKGDLGQIYKVVTMLRVKALPNYVDYLQSMLNRVKPEDHVPYFELTRGQLMLKRYAQAEQSATALMEKYPEHFRPVQWLAVALMGQGRMAEAEKYFRKVLLKRDDVAEIYFNYALLKRAQNKDEEAVALLKKALALRPNMHVAWFYLGEVAAGSKQLEQAVGYYQKALSIDPAFERGYLGLAKAYQDMGDINQALRYLKHGHKVANRTEGIGKMLSDISVGVLKPLLNSERIKLKFGSYGIDVLKADERLRISNLYSSDKSSRTTRTLAVVSYPETIDEALAEQHREIVSGQSLGAVFKRNGWKITKSHEYFGVIAPSEEYAALYQRMGDIKPVELAVHIYQFKVSKGKGVYNYATIAEIHHPDYLTLDELKQIYSTEFGLKRTLDESNKTFINVIDEILKDL